MLCFITEQRSPYLALQMRHDEGREAGMEKAFRVPNNGCSDNQMEMRVGKTDRPGTHWDSALTAAGSHRKCVSLHVNSHVFHQAV